jgi:hypothetical protein
MPLILAEALEALAVALVTVAVQKLTQKLCQSDW